MKLKITFDKLGTSLMSIRLNSTKAKIYTKVIKEVLEVSTEKCSVTRSCSYFLVYSNLGVVLALDLLGLLTPVVHVLVRLLVQEGQERSTSVGVPLTPDAHWVGLSLPLTRSPTV